LNGYEFVSALKGDPDTRHIPVVFVTSDDDVDRTRSCSAPPRTLFTQT
jgi:CheY-like chemotaxis protein